MRPTARSDYRRTTSGVVLALSSAASTNQTGGQETNVSETLETPRKITAEERKIQAAAAKWTLRKTNLREGLGMRSSEVALLLLTKILARKFHKRLPALVRPRSRGTPK